MSNPLAGKFGYAGGIPERKVRPIWDAIDSRQFKNALKLCSSLLVKHPNLPYAMALKALILERMGKPEESLSICLEAKELLHKNVTLLMDDLTLSTLQIVFQRLDRLDLATSLYEYACTKISNNLELMMGLFNCYVREYAYVKQQQTAIKMYKLVGEERFLLWAVCSIQLQVSCGQGGEKLLGLAEGLLKKHIDSHSLHEPEALIVYISVLEQQAKYVDALEVLSGNLGTLILIEVDRLRLQGRLLAQSGDNAAAASTFQKILETCPDDWECFLHYLGCLLEDENWCNRETNKPRCPPETVLKLPHVTDDMLNSRIQDASDFIRKLETEASGDPKRGLLLAYLEIERRKLLHGIGDKEKFFDVIVQYFFRFGYLSCFCSDVEVFLDVLTPDEKMNMLEKLKESCGSMSMTPTKSLGQAISFQKMQMQIGINYRLPIAELESSAVKMVNLYSENLHLSKDLDPQEGMHGEELLNMASNISVQLYWRTGSVGYLLEAVMTLELGLNIRRFVSQYKMLLLHLYSQLGALPVAYEWYRTLDVKNILLEAVSHQILPQMISSPLWEDLNGLLKDYLKFMDDYLRESADLTFLAYRHRNYSKVIEFVQFKERLQQSNQYLIARVESSILRLKEKAANIEEEDAVFECLKSGTQVLELANETTCKSLTFNEDFMLRPWWTPTPQKNYLLGAFEEPKHPKKNLNYRTEWETSVQEMVEKRTLLPRMIYLSVQCVSASIKESTETNGSPDSSFSLEMKSLLERYVKVLGYSLNEAVKVVFDVADGQRSLEAFGSNVIDWMNFSVFLNAWSLSSRDSVIRVGEQSTSLWRVVNSLLEKCIAHKIRSSGPMACSLGGDLPVLVQLITEPFAWQSLVLQSYIRSSLPCGKKKKKSSGPTDISTSMLSQTIRESVSFMYSLVESVAKWLKEEVTKVDDEAVDQLLSTLTRVRGEGPGQIFQALTDLVSTADEAELGHEIFQAIKSWSPADIARKTLKGQNKMMSDFLRICQSQLKSLEAMKQQI